MEYKSFDDVMNDLITRKIVVIKKEKSTEKKIIKAEAAINTSYRTPFKLKDTDENLAIPDFILNYLVMAKIKESKKNYIARILIDYNKMNLCLDEYLKGFDLKYRKQYKSVISNYLTFMKYIGYNLIKKNKP